jgi:cytochrome c oxidase subunit II
MREMGVSSLVGRLGTMVVAILMAGCGLAIAQEPVIGRAVPDQLGMQPVVTQVGAEMRLFHDQILLPIIIVISLFVLGLLLYVIFRFNDKANPQPSKVTHNTILEVLWTVAPVMILVVIAIPSFRLLTHQLVIPAADVTVKVTGKQWYWSYDYPADQGGFSFDSFPKSDAELKAGEPRLLAVDNEVVVPVNKVVRLQVTAADVIHSFVVQAFGVRVDAVPGRLNETWFKADREGIYYGQCSKLCGKDHYYMPIAVRVVSEKAYAEWLIAAKKKFATMGAPIASDAPATLASIR